MNRKNLSDHALQLIAARFRLLGEPMRLRILIALEHGERTVSGLVAATGGTQANISRHLKTLAEAGILTRRKHGLHVLYAIADPAIFQLCEQVCGSLEQRISTQAQALGLSHTRRRSAAL